MSSENRMIGSGPAGVSNRFVSLARRENLPRVSLKHIFQESGATGRRVTAYGQSSITCVHQKEHVLCLYKFGISGEIIPSNQGLEIVGISVHWNQEPYLPTLACARTAMTSKEHNNAVITSYRILSKMHERRKDSLTGSVLIY
jgi:hypothetical protein